MYPPLVIGLRIFLGIIFLYASWDKILNPGPFAEVVYNYQVLPDALINLTAIVLPWLELFLGLCLIFGLWLPGAVFLSNALLIVFFSTLLFNLARGLNVQCGCFSTSPTTIEGSAIKWYILRDFLFLAAALILFYQTYLRYRKKPLST